MLIFVFVAGFVALWWGFALFAPLFVFSSALPSFPTWAIRHLEFTAFAGLACLILGAPFEIFLVSIALPPLAAFAALIAIVAFLYQLPWLMLPALGTVAFGGYIALKLKLYPPLETRWFALFPTLTAALVTMLFAGDLTSRLAMRVSAGPGNSACITHNFLLWSIRESWYGFKVYPHGVLFTQDGVRIWSYYEMAFVAADIRYPPDQPKVCIPAPG